MIQSIKRHLLKLRPFRYFKMGRWFVNNKLNRDAARLAERERLKTPKRSDIINHLLSRHQPAQRYLEIGVRNPADNFRRIHATQKFGVDPGVEFASNPVEFKMTSDEFFQLLRTGKALPPGYKFHVIFIDGLHTAVQANRDITNALEFLESGGFVVLHDCNPPTEWHARETFAYPLSPAGPDWNGTTWKAFVKWRSNKTVSSCCIDTDWGVGIISPDVSLGAPTEIGNEFYDYADLAANRKAILNLITFDELDEILNSKPATRLKDSPGSPI